MTALWIGLGAVVLATVIGLALARAAKRGDLVDPDREEHPLDIDADRPDTNGETR